MIAGMGDVGPELHVEAFGIEANLYTCFHLMSSRIRNLIRLAGGPIDQGYECVQVRQPP